MDLPYYRGCAGNLLCISIEITMFLNGVKMHRKDSKKYLM